MSSEVPDPVKESSTGRLGKLLSAAFRGATGPVEKFNARRRTTLTLSLEGTSVRFLRSHKGVITSWASLSFNPRLMRGGRIEDPRGMAEVITNGLGRLEDGDRSATVIAAFPSTQMFIRYVTVPRVRGIKPETIIQREGRRLLGTAADQQIFFWTRLAASPLEYTYYLLAVPRVEMARFIETLQRSNLMPQRIDARPLALARAMPEDDGILLRLEATDLSVTVMVDRIPELVTRRNLEITMSADDLLAEIADAVQTTVSFQTTRPENKALLPEAPLFLFGAHPQVDETLAVSIAEATNRVVRLPTSPREAPSDFPALEYMVNVGLALKGPG